MEDVKLQEKIKAFLSVDHGYGYGSGYGDGDGDGSNNIGIFEFTEETT